MDANGKLHPHHTAVSGYRYYSDEQLNQVINVKPKKRITIGYCRVSSRNKNINKSQKVKKSEKQKRRLQRSISRSYEKNKRGESYCKTNNVIKKEKLLLKRNHRLTNIRKNYLNQTISEIVNRKPRFICMEDLNVRFTISAAIKESSLLWLTGFIHHQSFAAVVETSKKI